MDNTFGKKNFTKAYADDSQKPGGELYWQLQKRVVKTLPRPLPQPSEHALMRMKKLHGPVRKTKAYKKWSSPKEIAKRIAYQKGNW